jgi:glycogen debranching enzyme
VRVGAPLTPAPHPDPLSASGEKGQDTLHLTSGRPWPLGASVDAHGVNFAVFSQHATRVELCLFDSEGRFETQRLALPGHSGDVWHGHLVGARAGMVYGLRVHGPWRPDRGHRFNPAKLLLDPWAQDIVPPPDGFDWRGPHFGADREHPQSPDGRDNGPAAFKARVVDLAAETAHADLGPRPPHAPEDTVVMELHVRGFTRRLSSLPAAEQGTYAGLASDAAVAHFKRLGINTLCLLPVMQHLDEAHLVERGLVNHWGYNTLGFFCPDPRHAATADVRGEFRQMVRRLHEAGIAVWLDVVFNHTPEGDERGATLSWRGLDNLSWYRLQAGQPAQYENWTGCGNTLDIRHPRVLQFVMDSLRHWVQAFGVDGFRFDLAPVLGRGDHGFDRRAAFFQAVQQDPVLQGVTMVAEPWDVGPSGWQVGQFPRGWREWNDRFRDTARAFWLGGDCTRGELALRLAGSSDLYQPRQRSPLESINYVVSHDGFTLHDLVSHDLRHNEANGEGNRDGHGHNLSWNCGWEGPTTDPEVLARRARLKRALLATVLLSQGTPMLAAGDELGHSQGGNNNPYCQDNDTTWIDWAAADQSLIDFTAHLITLRRRLLPLAPRWYTGLPDAKGRHDLAWLRRNGQAMTPEHWNNRMSRILGAWIGSPGRGGEALLLLINGRDMDASFRLPPGQWVCELDSTQARGQSPWTGRGPTEFELPARSVVLMRNTGST